MSATRSMPTDEVSPDHCDDSWLRCADCGTDYHRGCADDPGFCDYCYEPATRYLVKLGNKVLYKGYDEGKADAAHSAALDRQEWKVRFSTTPDVLINRRQESE